MHTQTLPFDGATQTNDLEHEDIVGEQPDSGDRVDTAVRSHKYGLHDNGQAQPLETEALDTSHSPPHASKPQDPSALTQAALTSNGHFKTYSPEKEDQSRQRGSLNNGNVFEQSSPTHSRSPNKQHAPSQGAGSCTFPSQAHRYKETTSHKATSKHFQKESSRSLERKPIEVRRQTVDNRNKIIVKVDNSLDSKESQIQYAMQQAPTLHESSQHTKGIGVQVSSQGAGLRLHNQSLISTQRSFEVQPPRYNAFSKAADHAALQRPRVTIEAQTLNKDLQTLDQRGSLEGHRQGYSSPTKQKEFRAAPAVQVSPHSELNQAKADLQVKVAMSPSMRGGKLNMSKQASVRAIKGFKQTSSPSPRQAHAHAHAQQPAINLRNGFAGASASYGISHSKPTVAQQSQSPSQRKTKLHKQHAGGESKRKQEVLEEPVPFENVLAGTQVKIQATPVSHYIKQHKQKLAKMATTGPNLPLANMDPTQPNKGLGEGENVRSAIKTFPVATEGASRGGTPDLELDEGIVKLAPTQSGYKQRVTTQYAVGGNAGFSPKAADHSSLQSSLYPGPASVSGRAGFGSHQAHMQGSNRARQSAKKHKSLKQALSKDLIAVINDHSDEEASLREQQKLLVGQKRSSQLEQQASEGAAADRDVEQKRGSAITFFDESDNGGDARQYDEMNVTLDAFKRPSITQNKGSTEQQIQLDGNGPPGEADLKNEHSQKLLQMKRSLREFHQQHQMQVQVSSKQLMKMFPDLHNRLNVDLNVQSTQTSPLSSKGLSLAQLNNLVGGGQQVPPKTQTGYTSSIPCIQVSLNEDQINANQPASGIRIFEEHNSPRHKNHAAQHSKANNQPRSRDHSSEAAAAGAPAPSSGSYDKHLVGVPQGTTTGLSYQVAPLQHVNQKQAAASKLQQLQSTAMSNLHVKESSMLRNQKKNMKSVMNGTESIGTLPLDQVGAGHSASRISPKQALNSDMMVLEGPSGSPTSLSGVSRATNGTPGLSELQKPATFTLNEHKRVMQTLSPKPVVPNLAPALTTQGFHKLANRDLGVAVGGGMQSTSMRQKKLTMQVERNKRLVKQGGQVNGSQGGPENLPSFPPLPSATYQNSKKVHLDLTQKIGGNQMKVVARKNTEKIGAGDGQGLRALKGINENLHNTTMQRDLTALHDNLNATIQKHDVPFQKGLPGEGSQNLDKEQPKKKEDSQQSGGILDQVLSLQDSVYVQKAEEGTNNDHLAFIAIEDALTLEQKESAMARYLDAHGGLLDQEMAELTVTSKHKVFNLTNNMMSLRQMQPKEASVFPLSGPPPVQTTQRFNVTQFKHQLQLLDINSKFNSSFVTSPRSPGQAGASKTMPGSKMLKSPTTDMRIKINHRDLLTGAVHEHQANPLYQTYDSFGLGGDAQGNAMTVADKIREQRHLIGGKLSQGGSKLSNMSNPNHNQRNQTQTSTNFGPSHQGARSRSIDPRTSAAAAAIRKIGQDKGQSPFGSSANKGLKRARHSHSQANEVAKRFKNMSEREAPANHISDKVYATAQNQSHYNNAYQFVSSSQQANLENHRQSPTLLNKSVSGASMTSPNASKAKLIDSHNKFKSKYTQRKLSNLERPTQLEIGGEGSPMLSLLPPLKTREISPKFNFTVGQYVKEHQNAKALLKMQLEGAKKQNEKGQSKRAQDKHSGTNRLTNQVHYLPSTKIIISQSGDSPERVFHETSENQISKHPVMIKAVSSSRKSLEGHSPGRELGYVEREDSSRLQQITEHTGRVSEEDTRFDSSTANYLQNEYRDVFLVNQDSGLVEKHPGALQVNPLDASLNEKLAQMANKVYKDVVVPLEQVKEDDPVNYERRRLNVDGTWKENRYRGQGGSPSPAGGPSFHFLEYASKNFKNPLEVLKANSSLGSGATTVAQTQQLALDSLEQFAALQQKHTRALSNPKFGVTGPTQQQRIRSRAKRAHHSQAYHVDEKFSLKVQKKPMHGLQHIKVQQANGPGGVKLYSIKVKQKGPRFVSGSRVKDSIEAPESSPLHRETLNVTRRLQETFEDISSPMTQIDEHSRFQMMPRGDQGGAQGGSGSPYLRDPSVQRQVTASELQNYHSKVYQEGRYIGQEEDHASLKS